MLNSTVQEWQNLQPVAVSFHTRDLGRYCEISKALLPESLCLRSAHLELMFAPFLRIQPGFVYRE